MKTTIRYPHLFIFFVTVLFLSSCKKDISSDYSSPELSMKVNSWLDKQKQKDMTQETLIAQSSSVETKTSDSDSKKNENIDMLKANLEYDARVQSEISRNYNYIIIPIKDEIKIKKKVEKSATLSLVLITDKSDNIISGSIACYLPKDRKPRGYVGVQTIADVYKGKASTDSGMIKFMDVTGRRLHEIGFKKGRISSYGEIKSKNTNQTKVSNISECTDWYLNTTYYDEYYNIIEQTSEYIGTTCTGCNSGEYGSPCPGAGGGGSGGSGGNNGQEWQEEVTSSSDEIGGFQDNTPSGISTEPNIHLSYGAMKKIMTVNQLPFVYDVNVFPITIPFAEQEVTFISSNGTTVWRSAFITNQRTTWCVLTQPVVMITWAGLLRLEYVWFGGWDMVIKPVSHIKVQ